MTQPPAFVVAAPAAAPAGLAARLDPASRTARVARWPGWRDPYLVLGALLVLLAIGVSLRQPWEGDFGIHAATIERLKVDLLHPGNPMVDDPGPSAYYSPYTVALGLVARLTGWSGRTVLGVAAPFLMLLFLAGLYRFVTTMTRPARPRYAPVAVLLAVLLAWGTTPLDWSGFVTLFGLPLTVAYPSFVALGLTLLLWASLRRSLDGPAPWWRFALLGVGAAAIALIHPFTALVMAFGAVALVVDSARGARVWWRLVVAAAPIALMLAWPYYHLLDLLNTTGFDAVHRPLYTYALGYFGLALVCLPALWLRWRRDRLDPLVLLFVLSGLTVLVGGVTGHYAFGRAWPGVLLAAQLALGLELGTRLSPAPTAPTASGSSGRPARWAGRAWVGVTAVVLLIGLWFQLGNVLLALPASKRLAPLAGELHTTGAGPDLTWIRIQARTGDVVLTARTGWLQALPGYGLRTMVPAWPDPYLSDVDERTADQARILDPATPQPVRAQLLTRYHVRWILVPAASTVPTPDWALHLVATGPARERLYAVD